MVAQVRFVAIESDKYVQITDLDGEKVSISPLLKAGDRSSFFEVDINQINTVPPLCGRVKIEFSKNGEDYFLQREEMNVEDGSLLPVDDNVARV